MSTSHKCGQRTSLRISGQPATRERPHERPSHILLADDDLEMRRMLAWSLRQAGYEVTECEDGMCLMKHLGLLGPSEKAVPVDLILSDIRMPGVNGMQVLKSIREFEDCPPIILMTAFADENTQKQTQQLGAAAMMNKPFDIDELIHKVISLVSPQTTSLQEPTVPLRYPIDIVFRHDSGSEPLQAFIEEIAGKLNRYADRIMSCQVVMDVFHSTSEIDHQVHVVINLALPGKIIVVKYPPEDIVEHESAYLVIQIAFGKIYHKLKHYFSRSDTKQRKQTKLRSVFE